MRRKSKLRRKSKYEKFNFCGRHGWIPKKKCPKVRLKNGILQDRCPFCNKPIRVSPREKRFRQRYIRPSIFIKH